MRRGCNWIIVGGLLGAFKTLPNSANFVANRDSLIEVEQIKNVGKLLCSSLNLKSSVTDHKIVVTEFITLCPFVQHREYIFLPACCVASEVAVASMCFQFSLSL